MSVYQPGAKKGTLVRDFVNYLYLPPDGKIDPRPLGYWSVYREEGRLCGIIVAIQLFTPQILTERYVLSTMLETGVEMASQSPCPP